MKSCNIPLHTSHSACDSFLYVSHYEASRHDAGYSCSHLYFYGPVSLRRLAASLALCRGKSHAIETEHALILKS